MFLLFHYSSQPTHENALTACTQTLFGLAASHAEANLKSSNPLLELITEGFDEEQIWQELELQNKPGVGSLVKHVAKAIAVRNRLQLQIPNEQDNLEDGDGDEDEEGSLDSDDEQDIEEEDDEEADEDEMMDSEDEQEDLSLSRTKKSKKASKDSDESGESDTNFDIDELHSRTKPKKKAAKANKPIKDKSERGKSSVVDDRFFRLDDMEKFLEMEDAKEAKRVRRMERGDGSDNDDNEDDEEEDDDEDPVDFFEDALSDDEGFDDEDDDDEEKQVTGYFFFKFDFGLDHFIILKYDIVFLLHAVLSLSFRFVVVMNFGGIYSLQILCYQSNYLIPKIHFIPKKEHTLLAIEYTQYYC